MQPEAVPANIITSDHILATTTKRSQKLNFKPAGSIVTRSFTGYFRNLRLTFAGILVTIFFATSWLQWGGRQAVLWDLEERKFYIFGATFWPQDFTLLSAILIISAFGLLAANVFVGRVWCGYTCPQSVWTWAFMRVEHIAEGDRNQRIKLSASPWSFNKIFRRVVKHSLWVAMSIATGVAFIGYFVPVKELTDEIFTGQWFSASAFWVFMFAAGTYANAGWLREQVCLHMCPYSRFQSVMFDKDTLVVTYNKLRGENRGSRRKEDDYKANGLGDCIDCQQCVQVCPTGIDIRDGLQIDCIGCAACVDACDSVMDKMSYPRGLISYTSERAQSGEPAQKFRPLVLAYIAAILVVIGSLGFILYDRELVAVNVIKDRNLYRKDSEGHVINVYRLKVMNKTQYLQTYQIELLPNSDLSLKNVYKINLFAGEILDVPVSVIMNSKGNEQGLIPFTFLIKNLNDETIYSKAKTSFIFPVN